MTCRLAAFVILMVHVLFAGDRYTFELKSAPFPHPLREAGHTYHNQLFSAEDHYSDSSVLVFIPDGFQPGLSNDFVIHFHGWYNTKDSADTYFKLSEQFESARKNAILIIPEGPKNAPDSFGGKLSDPGGFDQFLLELTDSLLQHRLIKNTPIGSIILTGHSGGYSVIGNIIQKNEIVPKIAEIHLYDGLYGYTENYFQWMQQKHVRFMHITTDQGGTLEESEGLTKLLRIGNIPCKADTENHFFSQPDFSKSIILLHSNLSHNEVLAVRKQYFFFIKNSCLSDIP